MDYTKKILSQEEINDVEDLIYKKMIMPIEFFNKNIIDYNSAYSEDETMDLIINFLNNFSSHVDDELDFHYDLDRFNLVINLIKPIIQKSFMKFKLKQKNDTLQIYLIFGDKTVEINSELFNCVIAYMVCHGLVYDYEIDSIIKKK